MSATEPECPDPAKIDELVDYARAGGLEPHDEGNGMGTIERCDHCERGFDETEETFVSESGGDICAHCAATWLGEERTRLREQLAGAVVEIERLKAERDRAVETRENANAVSVRVEGEIARLPLVMADRDSWRILAERANEDRNALREQLRGAVSALQEAADYLRHDESDAAAVVIARACEVLGVDTYPGERSEPVTAMFVESERDDFRATLDRLEHLLSSPGDMSPDEIRAEGRRLIAETRGDFEPEAEIERLKEALRWTLEHALDWVRDPDGTFEDLQERLEHARELAGASDEEGESHG